MSENAPNAPETGGNDSGATPAADGEFTPITSQDELNRIIGERVKRAKPADYNDLKAKAARLDEIEQANKSEIEKATERVTKAEAEVAQIPAKVAEALRTHLVARHEIDKDDAELFLTANDPELLLKQVDRLLAQSSARKPTNHVPREGASPAADESNDAIFARGLLSGD